MMDDYSTNNRKQRGKQTIPPYKEFREKIQFLSYTVSSVLDDFERLQTNMRELSMVVSKTMEIMLEEIYQIEYQERNDYDRQEKYLESSFLQGLLSLNFQTFFNDLSNRYVQPLLESLDNPIFLEQKNKIKDLIEVVDHN
jgi:hypothetical protein